MFLAFRVCSTVSKVLRQKEKYLFPDDGSRSPVKRSKGKFPDIERALSVWAKNTRKQGITLTDVMIREKARFFATSLGISDSHFKANSASWLEKFKHKNNVHPGGRGRSESDATGIGRTVMRQSHTRTESINCDDSGSPMMMQHSKSQDSDSPNSHTLPPHHHQASDSPDSLSFSAEFSGGYKAFQHQNSGSLDPFAYPPETEKVVLGPASPASPFFSPHDHPSPGFPSVHARMAPGTYQRPRSQTFPLLPIDGTYISPPPSSEPLTPGAAAASAASPAGGSPPPPSKDEAKQALEVVITFLRRQPAGFVEQDEYVMVGKLREKFGLSAGQMDAEAADTIMGFSNNPP